MKDVFRPAILIIGPFVINFFNLCRDLRHVPKDRLELTHSVSVQRGNIHAVLLVSCKAAGEHCQNLRPVRLLPVKHNAIIAGLQLLQFFIKVCIDLRYRLGDGYRAVSTALGGKEQSERRAGHCCNSDHNNERSDKRNSSDRRSQCRNNRSQCPCHCCARSLGKYRYSLCRFLRSFCGLLACRSHPPILERPPYHLRPTAFPCRYRHRPILLRLCRRFRSKSHLTAPNLWRSLCRHFLVRVEHSMPLSHARRPSVRFAILPVVLLCHFFAVRMCLCRGSATVHLRAAVLRCFLAERVSPLPKSGTARTARRGNALDQFIGNIVGRVGDLFRRLLGRVLFIRRAKLCLLAVLFSHNSRGLLRR